MGTPPDTYNYNNEIAPEEIQSRKARKTVQNLFYS
ncbi:MAG: hypothetical protein QOG61_1617 [Candidatus Binataceae bacterium]|jgi:hypothetical protein|nr:hypothetical protein [Candidatus Binataceae bacterium]MEA2679576.1 hypothetical protein [Candidatus Binataceae bacterium]